MALLTETEVRARAQGLMGTVNPNGASLRQLTQLKVYPRGFLGAMLAPRAVKQHGQTETARGWASKDVTVMSDQNRFDAPNAAVEEIYNTYILDREKAKKFEFREQVLHVALHAFGHLNFFSWFRAQYENPSAGELHGRFLLDTLKFLQEGRRDMSLETWSAIITIDSSADPIGRLPDAAGQFFGLGQRHQRESDWSSIVQLWCSQPGGLEDLIGSLHVLFGAPAVQ